MLTWLIDAWHRADAWAAAHPTWTVLVGGLFSLVMVILTARVIARIAAKLVIRHVFGDGGRLQLPAESARQAAAAQTEAARLIAEHQREIVEEIQRMHTTMEAEVSAMMEAVRDGAVPLAIAVSTPEERQTLEALISRATPRVIVRANRTRRIRTDGGPAAEPDEENVATSWERLLTDDDEEGTPCPTPPTETTPQPPPPPQPPKKVKKTAKSRAPKTKKG